MAGLIELSDAAGLAKDARRALQGGDESPWGLSAGRRCMEREKDEDRREAMSVAMVGGGASNQLE